MKAVRRARFIRRNARYLPIRAQLRIWLGLTFGGAR